jgi:UDP-N-acetylglucosamine/UDP-N-acetylgalactosamine diphosphorylase
MPTQAEVHALKSKYAAAGQEHLFTFYGELSPEEQTALYAQLSKLDVDRVNRIYKKATATLDSTVATQNISPLPDDCFDSVLDAPESKQKEWESIGLKSISENKVAVILMAGGQGTRLGSSAPKGCYDIGLPSHKSLFQLQAERILRLQKIAKEATGVQGQVVIPWYVMTSGPTRAATEGFFRKNGFFGLKEQNVIVFEQGV